MMKPSKPKDDVIIWDEGITVLPTVFLPDTQTGNSNSQTGLPHVVAYFQPYLTNLSIPLNVYRVMQRNHSH